MNNPFAQASKEVTSRWEDEAELVSAIRAGSEPAFRELVERFRERLYRVAYRLVRNEEEAEDVAQEAFVKAYRSLDGFAGRSSLMTWLYRITRNLALDHLRKRKSHLHVSLDEEPPTGEGLALAERLPDPAASPTHLAADAELFEVVRRELARLSDKHREVLELREFEAMSYQEIAEAVGCNVGTVMSRLYYARSELAERLRPYLERMGDERTRTP